MSQAQKQARRLGGKKAKANGDQFEQIIQLPARRESVSVIKIPSGCRWVRGPGRTLAVPTKTPFDFVFIRDGVPVFFDAKSTTGKTFSASKVTPHQLFHMLRCHEAGARAGYIVYFQTLDRIVFFAVEKLNALTKGQSLKPEDGISLGSALTLTLLPLFF